jgi:hypothetical protein
MQEMLVTDAASDKAKPMSEALLQGGANVFMGTRITPKPSMRRQYIPVNVLALCPV